MALFVHAGAMHAGDLTVLALDAQRRGAFGSCESG